MTDASEIPVTYSKILIDAIQELAKIEKNAGKRERERERQRETCKNKVRTKRMKTRDADGKRLYKTFECEMNFNLCFILQEKKKRETTR